MQQFIITYYNFNKLPQALSFFNGARFVPFMVIIIVLPISVGIGLVWPLFQTVINHLGNFFAKEQKLKFLAPFLIWNFRKIIITIWITPHDYNSYEL
ncbi:phosphotransferase system, EIIC family protein [Mycoplasma mycoides subsp. mycoides]|uniref:Phosphotransferase system, EIIC family protein n=1 Tax=Mycoplasma mycoides subsp. mycoides TaxID=2103 RepID=A0AAE2EIB6_MYCMY|nr:conserved domain protein [Mycoplasma mycoides subsp. mycoides SC str. Gladysdale]AMK56985.1 bifunctional PTS system maltose andglucose-specific transporter subunits IICB [Mycoplasma mycoides subsp. mycoides]KJQ45950.1 phosphotransferase system, EIIC family protein [Mycoplasma mycoides subsp. mycoides]KJQ47550.1 phosphotransferase system, EIIC family protein [Mycoplasma mycoides subsp. mycoides]BCU84398.1 hypothetical protein mmcaprivi_07770 [Mycoplasma mycoides]